MTAIRGFSHGALTPQWFARWTDIESWTCDDTGPSLTLQVRGAGLAGVLAQRPVFGATRAWTVPSPALDDLRLVLRERAGAAESRAGAQVAAVLRYRA